VLSLRVGADQCL